MSTGAAGGMMLPFQPGESISRAETDGKEHAGIQCGWGWRSREWVDRREVTVELSLDRDAALSGQDAESRQRNTRVT